MDPFFALIVIGIALEALVQLLKNAWDADVRSSWTYTRAAVVIIPVAAAWIAETNIVPASLAFDIDEVGYIISGLVVGRVAQWVHDLYKKTA